MAGRGGQQESNDAADGNDENDETAVAGYTRQRMGGGTSTRWHDIDKHERDESITSIYIQAQVRLDRFASDEKKKMQRVWARRRQRE